MDNRKEKFISADLLCDLAKVLLKSNVFKSSKDTLSKKRETTIGTKFVPPYNNHFVAELEKATLRKAEFQFYLLRRYIFLLGAWKRKTKVIHK